MLDRSRRHRQRQQARRVAVALLLVALVCVFVDARRDSGGSLLSGVHDEAAQVVAPVTEAAGSVVASVQEAAAAVTHARRSERRLAAVQRENAELRSRLALRGDVARRSSSLQKMLGAAAAGQFSVVAAQTLTVGSGMGFEWTAQIDAGSREGVRRDQTVVNGDGLVGRVVAVTATTATVLLAVDPTFTVGVRTTESRQIGLVSGRGLAAQRLQMLDPTAILRPGAQLVTLGSQPDGSPFVAGVTVGSVLQVEASGGTTRTALVDPALRASALDVVGVVVAAPRPPRLPLPPAAQQ